MRALLLVPLLLLLTFEGAQSQPLRMLGADDVIRGQVFRPRIETQAKWADAPADAEIQATKPAGVAVAAYATISCRSTTAGGLVDCRPEAENPAGVGLGAAAISLAPRFRLDPQTTANIGGSGARVTFEMGWRGRGGDCYPPVCTPILPAPPPPPPIP